MLKTLDDDGLLDEVGLGDDKDLVARKLVYMAGNPLIPRANRLRCIDEKRHDINISQRLQGRLIELGTQGVLRLVDARRVDDDHLHVIGIVYCAEAMARGLGRTRCDGEFGAHDMVEQR